MFLYCNVESVLSAELQAQKQQVHLLCFSVTQCFKPYMKYLGPWVPFKTKLKNDTRTGIEPHLNIVTTELIGALVFGVQLWKDLVPEKQLRCDVQDLR